LSTICKLQFNSHKRLKSLRRELRFCWNELKSQVIGSPSSNLMRSITNCEMRLKLRTFYKVSLDITFTFTGTKLKIQFSCLKQTFAFTKMKEWMKIMKLLRHFISMVWVNGLKSWQFLMKNVDMIVWGMSAHFNDDSHFSKPPPFCNNNEIQKSFNPTNFYFHEIHNKNWLSFLSSCDFIWTEMMDPFFKSNFKLNLISYSMIV